MCVRVVVFSSCNMNVKKHACLPLDFVFMAFFPPLVYDRMCKQKSEREREREGEGEREKKSEEKVGKSFKETFCCCCCCCCFAVFKKKYENCIFNWWQAGQVASSNGNNY